jgi:hypothetical protein
MAKTKEKSPLQRLQEQRRGVLSKKEWNRLTTVMVPPTEWTNWMLEIGPHGPPCEVQGMYLDRQNVIHRECDVQDIYWDWCHDEQNRRREIFLRWMGAIEAGRDAPRAARFLDKRIGKEIVVMAVGHPTVGSPRKDQVFLGWVKGPLGESRKTNPRFGLAEHFDGNKWPKLVWELAKAIFAGLRLPAPYKRGATPKEAQEILDAVAHVHKIAPKLNVSTACKRAGTNKTDFYRVGGKSWRQPRPEK